MASPVNDAVFPSHLFPDDFPYDLDSESEGGEQDEDEFLAQLTRRLTQKLALPRQPSHAKPQKSCMAASSPQSTLSGLGSPSQFPSPPTTPFGDQIDTWNLIYAAAGQVARLKMSNESPQFQTRPLLKQSSVQNNLAVAEINKRHLRREQRLRTGPPSWAADIPVQPYNRPAQTGGRTLLLAGSGAAVRRESAGTGVFLPRRNGNSPEFRKKTVVMPAKVEQAHLNFHEIKGYSQANYSSNNPGSSYDGLMTGRNAAAVSHINRSYRVEGTRLPNEWTY